MSEKSQLDVVLSLKDEMSGKLAGVKNKLSGIGSNLATMGSYAAVGFGALSAGLGVAGGMAIKSAAEIETLKVALRTAMGGDDSAAGEAFKTIEKFATKTPYQMGEVLDSFIKLKNMGLNPSEEALTAYGDTASSMGKGLNQMIEAVADAATGEFERLKEFGIRSKQEGDKVSFTFKGVTTTVGKNSKEIEDYLIKLGQTNFGGGMDAQSKTLAGRFSTLKDTVGLTMASIANDTGLFYGVKTVVLELTESLEENKEKILQFINRVSEALMGIYDLVVLGDFTGAFGRLFNIDEDSPIVGWILTVRQAVIDFFSEVENRKAVMVGVLAVLTVAFGAWAISVIAAVAPMILIMTAIGTAAGLLYTMWTQNWGGIQEKTKAVMEAIVGFYNAYIVPFFKSASEKIQAFVQWWKENWDSISLIFEGAWKIMKGIFQVGWAVLSGVVKVAIDIFTGNWKKAWEDVQGIFKGVWEGIKNIFGGIWDGIKGIFITSINYLIDKLNDFIGKVNDIDIPDWVPGVGGKGINIKKIPRLATGTNYVPRDTLAVIHEGEAVVPKKYNPYAGGSGMVGGSVYIENIIVQNEADEDRLIDKIRKELSRDQEKANWGIA